MPPPNAPHPGPSLRFGARSMARCAMLLVPIGRDNAEIRRHAWVSYAIIAINVLVFIATMTAERESKVTEINLEWQKALEYHLRRPYLQTPDAMKDVVRV